MCSSIALAVLNHHSPCLSLKVLPLIRKRIASYPDRQGLSCMSYSQPPAPSCLFTSSPLALCPKHRICHIHPSIHFLQAAAFTSPEATLGFYLGCRVLFQLSLVLPHHSISVPQLKELLET